MHFKELRLHGFKSFVDHTRLPIEPGLTGIVGPNGCGKSNLVEAVRWVMGETSAKRMRGAEMDDVIFGGTTDRPARNLAEVMIVLDNGDRTAPPAYNEIEELEVSRRIGRGQGSDYRVNGKSVRARDVQLLFQDAASGPLSPALVSQGRVAAIINAKPADRRMLLEEAAGITGLHSRRHEAELRLRAAEENLVRLDDVIGAMEAQLANLKKQARQATRYRNLSGAIRETEARLLLGEWRAAATAEVEARQGFDANERVVGDRTLAVTQAQRRRDEAAEAVPPAREEEARVAAVLQRHLIAREQLAAEAERLARARAEAENRLRQIDADRQREEQLGEDARTALERLSTERIELEAARTDEAETLEAARALAEAASAEAADVAQAVDRLTHRRAAEEADAQAQARRVRELEERVGGLDKRLETLEKQRREVADALSEAGGDTDAGGEIAQLESDLARARERATEAEAALATAGQAADAARESLDGLRAENARLTAEADGLRAILADGKGSTSPPIVDRVTVAPGYETAFAAALGDDAELPEDAGASRHWAALPPFAASPLPDGVERLADQVTAPPVLARRLAAIGVVADAEVGSRLAPSLEAGQLLVTRDGGTWRWDGVTAKAGAPSAAAVRLEQRNRLAKLVPEVEKARAAVEAASAELEARRSEAQAARSADQAAREAVSALFNQLNAARETATRQAQALANLHSRRSSLEESAAELTAERTTAASALEEGQAALAALPDGEATKAELEAARGRLAGLRQRETETANAVGLLAREAETRSRRLTDIAAEATRWTERSAGTQARLEELAGRAEQARAEIATLADRPALLDRQREELAEAIAEAETARTAAGDRLASAETALGQADRAQKAAEQALAEAREERVRREAAVQAAMTAIETLRNRIRERLETVPEKLSEIAGLGAAEDMPDLDSTRSKLERLLRERENMGAVNLRAEAEVEEVGQQIEGMTNERNDLEQAIARLRQGISALNHEARQRLATAFEEVARHFTELFVRLFGGGTAELKLTDPEDPLTTGLDIYASPPGKKLTHLSLLSGGEQALTALSLLFAVFLTNPTPICVLDEVDAPLDDANVDRFCTLLDELARSGTTRFLLITHHRMTMARVDRLFGVTMAERGVSKLVSVDLTEARRLRATA